MYAFVMLFYLCKCMGIFLLWNVLGNVCSSLRCVRVVLGVAVVVGNVRCVFLFLYACYGFVLYVRF